MLRCSHWRCNVKRKTVEALKEHEAECKAPNPSITKNMKIINHEQVIVQPKELLHQLQPEKNIEIIPLNLQNKFPF